MKIAILEDRPWVMWEAVSKLQHMKVEQVSMIYYQVRKEAPDKISEIMEKCKQFGVSFSHAKNNVELTKQLDDFLRDDQTVVFMDYVINDPTADRYEDQVNYLYAKKKQDEGEGRIWFYTTAGVDEVDKLNKVFANRCIPVPEFNVRDQQVVLDYEYIEGILNN